MGVVEKKKKTKFGCEKYVYMGHICFARRNKELGKDG